MSDPVVVPVWLVGMLAAAGGLAAYSIVELSLALRRQCRRNRRLVAERERLYGAWLVYPAPRDRARS